MNSLLEVIKKVDVVPYPHESEYKSFINQLYTLISHDESFALGYLLEPVVNELRNFPETFIVDDSTRKVKFHPSLNTKELREDALHAVGQKWKQDEPFETLKGWRDEKYTIYDQNKKPYFNLERSMCPLLGVVMYGVHINGYVKDEHGNYSLWIPRRAKDKPTYPGMLDNTVGGGLGFPYGPLETVYKECYEEAGLEVSYLKEKLFSCGMISYFYQLKPYDFQSELGLVQPEVEYIYDIEMDSETVPHPVDNESEDFRLMPIEEVKVRLFNGEFKDNCGAVIVDFMIRHSLLTPELEPDYLEINNRLHRFLPFPTKSY
ncbi:hypothetical protein CANINC_004528 [Pichia inconspicua]|uniref:Nudix hydrolase domain-containing protein n=1 Tax=Pichia inconspicua TaxID=52247 RepID=A0A4T0WVJ3_9ASCO|nr:hypothetical protein CANINC_004528 [[Candida] inconspicua]